MPKPRSPDAPPEHAPAGGKFNYDGAMDGSTFFMCTGDQKAGAFARPESSKKWFAVRDPTCDLPRSSTAKEVAKRAGFIGAQNRKKA
jgi:hypothetical protein